MTELSKIDYAPVNAKVKWYPKTYSRKNKYGKPSTVRTVQKSIPLSKDAPFKVMNPGLMNWNLKSPVNLQILKIPMH